MKDKIFQELESMDMATLADFEAEFASYTKERKDEAKASAKDTFKSEIGDLISVKFKGEVIEATVAKINEKSVTCEIALEDGEVVKRPILFHNIFGPVEDAEKEVEEDLKVAV